MRFEPLKNLVNSVVGLDFTDSRKRMFEFGFKEDLDFTPILTKKTN